MHELKIRQIGNSDGVVLPKTVLAKLKAGRGDTVYVTDTPGGVKLSVYDEQSAEQMRTAERIMKKRRNMLRTLAKS